jgi:hypothetical protein
MRGRTDGRTERQTGRHDEANTSSRFSQFCDKSRMLINIGRLKKISGDAF